MMSKMKWRPHSLINKKNSSKKSKTLLKIMKKKIMRWNMKTNLKKSSYVNKCTKKKIKKMNKSQMNRYIASRRYLNMNNS